VNPDLEAVKDKSQLLDGLRLEMAVSIPKTGYIFTNKRRSSGHRVTQAENHA
jgi:hypothetical protein